MTLDWPEARALAAGCSGLRESAAVGAASRWLALSIVWHDGEPRGTPRGISQPRRPRYRGEPNHALHEVPCMRPRTCARPITGELTRNALAYPVHSKKNPTYPTDLSPSFRAHTVPVLDEGGIATAGASCGRGERARGITEARGERVRSTRSRAGEARVTPLGKRCIRLAMQCLESLHR